MTRLFISNIKRKGTKDMWNAFMVQNAKFTKNDIPISGVSSTTPTMLIGWDEAKSIHKKMIAINKEYKYPAIIHFYLDDQKFDGKRSSVWAYPEKALQIIKHFEGIITPDFSTNIDFPKPIKGINFYRMRAYDCYMELEGIPYIHNVRWGSKETWKYCFDGIPTGSVVAIGTVASGIRKLENRKLFDNGFRKMLEVLQPKVIIIYGSSNYDVIKEAKAHGIKIVTFESKTSLAFKKKGGKYYE